MTRQFRTASAVVALFAAAALAAAALAAGTGALASGTGMSSHAGMMGGPQAAADMSAHVDHMLKHLYAEIDATDAQKAQIEPLVRQAFSDLAPLHSQLHSSHTRLVQALTQTPVDRTSLESVREEHLQLADQASKRFMQLVADVSDVLQPAQRKALADHLEHMHGMVPHY
jgi:Spy/CpxP family protein refolding chaperone